MQRRLTALLWTCLVWLAAESGSAHDPGLSELTLSQSALGIRFEWVLGDAELPDALIAKPGACDASRAVGIMLDGRTLPLRIRCRRYDASHTALAGTLATPAHGELRLTLLLLSELPRGHRVYARSMDSEGNPLAAQLLESTHASLQITLHGPSTAQLSAIGVSMLALLALPLLLHGRPRRASGESQPSSGVPSPSRDT